MAYFGPPWAMGDCPVCLEPVGPGDAQRACPECEGLSHAACAEAWTVRRATCPLCRCPTPRQLAVIAIDAPPGV